MLHQYTLYAAPPPQLAAARAPASVLTAALAAAASAPEGAASPTLEDVARAAVVSAAGATPTKRPAGVYYHRELLCRSLEGRRVDLVTISGTNRMLAGCEDGLGIDGLMPEGGERPRAFAGKPVFFLSARVHPGETPASHVLDGFLQFVLSEEDPRAQALRERFVFKLVPMINPDGVYRGHYRADTRGVNLNRTYLAATLREHPSVYAIGAVVRQLHARGELQFYVDTHGHATKRGCFLYGNAIADHERMVENVLYAKLVAANCRWFDFGGCVFSERNMYGRDKRDGLSKEGSGRVAVFKMSGLTHVYTLECNYNMGRVVNRIQPPHVPPGLNKARLSPPPPPLRTNSPKYTPESWRAVGRALAVAALDVVGANPCSRLGAGGAGGFARLRSSVTAWVRSHVKREQKRAARRAAAGLDGSEDDDDDDEGDGDDDDDADAAAADDDDESLGAPGDAWEIGADAAARAMLMRAGVERSFEPHLVRHAGGRRVALLGLASDAAAHEGAAEREFEGARGAPPHSQLHWELAATDGVVEEEEEGGGSIHDEARAPRELDDDVASSLGAIRLAAREMLLPTASAPFGGGRCSAISRPVPVRAGAAGGRSLEARR